MKIPININHEVFVQITEEGERLAARDYEKLIGRKPVPVRRDEDGWTKKQIHEVMSVFGKHMTIGCVDLPIKTTVILDTDHHPELKKLVEENTRLRDALKKYATK